LNPIDVLRRCDLLAHFSEVQFSQLAGCAEPRRLPSRTTILKEGEPSVDAYIIESGGVRIERKTPYGQFTLAKLEAGQLFGETSFVDGHARSSDVVTISETELLAFTMAELAAIIESDQRFGIALYWMFWKSLSTKLRLTNLQLTRFFSESHKPASAQPKIAEDFAGDFRVDLASKRKLFQEQKLSSLEINFLSSLSKEMKFSPFQQIFRESEPGEEMYVVLEGKVMISKYIPGAGEEALAFLERGDYFGEMALIDNEPRSADAKAHEEGAVVLAIPREVLAGILDIHRISSPRLLKILCTMVASRLRELDDKIIGWYILAGGPTRGWSVNRQA
jgi:CRP/FNR family transcriptional regulator, cyclic AMP receptor protein